MKRIENFVNKLAIAAVVAAPMAANAATDVTEVVTAIVAAGVAIATVGAAVLVMRVGGKAWKWITGAL